MVAPEGDSLINGKFIQVETDHCRCSKPVPAGGLRVPPAAAVCRKGTLVILRNGYDPRALTLINAGPSPCIYYAVAPQGTAPGTSH